MKVARSLRPIDLARAVGVSTTTVRKYEEWGIMPTADRSHAGYRCFDSRHVEAIQTMRALKAGYGWKPAMSIMRLLHKGDFQSAAAIVDECHAELVNGRREAERMAQALRTAHTAQDLQALVKPEHSQWPLRIGEVAKLLGVRVSAVRFWEDTGLLQPRRNTQSGYRLYDARHFEQARLVSSLRKAGCDLDSIRLVLPELAAHRPEQVLTIVEGRLVEIANASLRCSRAMVDFWNYLEHLNPNILDQIEYQRYYGPRKISPSPLDTPEAE